MKTRSWLPYLGRFEVYIDQGLELEPKKMVGVVWDKSEKEKGTSLIRQPTAVRCARSWRPVHGSTRCKFFTNIIMQRAENTSINYVEISNLNTYSLTSCTQLFWAVSPWPISPGWIQQPHQRPVQPSNNHATSVELSPQKAVEHAAKYTTAVQVTLKRYEQCAFE